MEEKIRLQDAENFAKEIQRLAEKGQIEAFSITIHSWSSDKLFELAQKLGIQELSVTAKFGS